MNIYKYTFPVKCPNNAKFIIYSLEIETDKMIMVEDIMATCDAFGELFHEDMAAHLQDRFGGKQVLIANHHGVDVETQRSAPHQTKEKRLRDFTTYEIEQEARRRSHWSYGMSETE